MTKAEIVARISRQSGIEKAVVQTVVEAFMENVKESMIAGNDVFLADSAALSSSVELKKRLGIFPRTLQSKFPPIISLHSSQPNHS